MKNAQQSVLTKREQQVLQVVYREKNLSAKQVWKFIPDFPSYSAVRSVLTILERKGLLVCRQSNSDTCSARYLNRKYLWSD